MLGVGVMITLPGNYKADVIAVPAVPDSGLRLRVQGPPKWEIGSSRQTIDLRTTVIYGLFRS